MQKGGSNCKGKGSEYEGKEGERRGEVKPKMKQ